MTSGQTRELVVAGVDGSEESIMALSWAARYAKATGAALQAVLAWHYPAAVGTAPPGVTPQPVRAQAEQYVLDNLTAAIGKAAEPAAELAEPRIAYGHAAPVLVDESGQADLLVVGGRGHSSFAGMLLGSVSTYCVSHARCPVLVVRQPR
ncbi:MAG TPA: universal stress protein [Streptosporangiaceae bacterium]|jgi:nucleotide-binding universal stress UspA family protein